MSEQLTSQSRLSSGISRRTALRGAAWSASAVTVVVATPNIAAASTTLKLTSGGAYRSSKDNNTHYVTWTFTVQAGSTPLTNLTASFSWVDGVAELAVTSGGTTWSGTGDTTRVYGTVPANGSVTVTVRFTRKNNGNGTASVILSAGSPSAVIGTLSAGYTEQR
jgi:hypothetical protein